jgi:hypothetical protein
MCAVNKVEGVLESSPYIWLILRPKENTLQCEYAYLHTLLSENVVSPFFSCQKNLQGI